MQARVWVVMPTYNEAANIEGIVRATTAELAEVAEGGHRILVVDDNSPDGTGAIADSLSGEVPQLEVLHRPGKAGLGQAYKSGFARALEGGAELVIEMDADFSHDPKYLGSLLRAAEGCTPARSSASASAT
jgi:dolichol-phosphate mannosyltransferase